MARAIWLPGGGGGTASDEVTAKREDVLNGKTAVTSDSNDEAGVGTMPNHGAVAPAALAAGGSYTIPKGYHNGSGKVTAKDLASQTAGTAGAADIRKGKTAVVGGKTVTGSMTEKGAQTYTPGTSNQTIGANQFLTGVQTIAGDADLTAGNIRTGANIFGKVGTYKGRGNAVQANVESGKTFSTASLDNASGSMAVMGGQTITPSKSQQTISCSGKKMSSNITINAIPSNFADLTAGAVVFKDGTFYNGFASRGKCKYSSGSMTMWPSNEPIIWPDPDPDDTSYTGNGISNSTWKETSYGLQKCTRGIICFSLNKSVNFDSINKIRVTVDARREWSSADPTINLFNPSKTLYVSMWMDGYGTFMPAGIHTRIFDVSKIKGHWFVNFSVLSSVSSSDIQTCIDRNERGATEMVFLA